MRLNETKEDYLNLFDQIRTEQGQPFDLPVLEKQYQIIIEFGYYNTDRNNCRLLRCLQDI